MEITNFSEVSEDFLKAAHSLVLCSVATVDTKNRVRSRVLHPIWESHAAGPVGWVATTTGDLKFRHLARNPHLSLCYLNHQDPFKPLYVDCRGEEETNPAEKARICHLFTNTPPPLGYDLLGGLGSVDNPAYAVLKLIPWRIELGDYRGTPRIWRAQRAD